MKFCELSESAKEVEIKEYHWIVECDEGHHGDEPFNHEAIREFLLSDDATEQGYLFTSNGKAHGW